MKRWLAALAAIALYCVPARGQGQQITAGPFPVSGLLYVCPVPSGGTPCPSPVSIFSNITLTTGISNPIVVFAQQSYTFYAASGQYTLEMPAAGYQAVVGGAGGGITQGLGPGSINPLSSTYGVQALLQAESTGANFTVTSASQTVICTTCKFQTSTYHKAAVGDIAWALTWNGADGSYSASNVALGKPGGVLTRVTITAVNSDTSITVSSAANANAGTTNSNNGVLVWGPDDDNGAGSPWSLVETAALTGLFCSGVQVPTGITNWSGAHFNNLAVTITCRGLNGGSTASFYPGLSGQALGGASTIAITPWFSLTNCNASVGCVGYGQYQNVSFNGFGLAGNVTWTVPFFVSENDGSYSFLSLWGLANSSAATNYTFQLQGGYHVAQVITVDGGGCPIGYTGNDHGVQMVFGGNGAATCPTAQVAGGSIVDDYSGAYLVGANGVMVAVGTGRYTGIGVIQALSSALGSACFNASTGYVYLLDAQCQNAGATNSVAIQITGAGTAIAEGSKLGGGATGKAWSCVATSTCLAGLGNSYSANPIGNIGCAVGTGTSPAACAGNSSGLVAVNTGLSSFTVNTTAITPNSVVIIQQDTSTTAGTALGVTCNTTVSTALPLLTAKTTGTSFAFSLTAPATNPDCFSYTVIN